MVSAKCDLLEKIDTSINKGINYLYHHQFPNGEFVCYIAPDEAMQEWCVPDSVTCITAIIGSCLLPFQNRPEVEHMLTKATGFLTYQMMRGGVWQYFTRWHHLYKYLPPDTDDTALISAFLKARKVTFPDNTPMLLMNRAKNGLFYTWFTLHGNFLKYSRTYWRLIARELKSPIKTLLYWTQRDHRRNDIDLIVNSNITCYLGYNKITQPVVKYIIDIIKQNQELESEKWYINRLVYYYFLSRLFKLNIPDLNETRDILQDRIFEEISKRKTFHECDVEIGLAISALLNIGSTSEKIGQYAERLVELQAHTGEWRRHELASGPARILVWGSEEATTGLCIEALHLYQKHLLKN
ncbi:hypothetical protein [Niabella ginsengisoli]|uniref:Prenyltransferase n=1 Tax=Niabella ginsengisoli TaxID=522298 RepID=A0ABS9SH03_9BACT|nr:hypothetical protein [Niabella ginsengisoli]MCH5597641.1 hypothetical protein [Niabella ginsengisoli]